MSQERSTVAPLSGLLNSSLQGIPGTRGFFFQAPIFRTEGFGGGNSITLKVVGPVNDEVVAASEVVMGKLIQVFQDFPRPDPANFNIGRPELRIVPDRERAGLAGVPETSVRTMAQVAVDGQIVGDYRYGGRAIDLTVLSNRPREETFVEDLDQVPLATRDGRIVPLSSVVQTVASTAPQQINRSEEQSAIAFTITLPPSISLSAATELIDNEVEKPLRDAGILGPGIRLQLTGSADKLQGFMAAFIPGFVLAAAVTYLLLAALMENWIYPIVIILTVPFAMAGGLVALAMLHAVDPLAKLDVLTMLGFVILIGTVINNPILIVYQALNFWRDGMERNEAIARSTQTRVRPIFMSVVTSLASLAPLVIFAGAGSELYRGLGAVIIGGLAVSTVVTLLITPTMLSLFMDFMKLVRREPDYRQGAGAPGSRFGKSSPAGNGDGEPLLAEPLGV
jgi:HAE1 family hydrophobic/amphiphilic exporter-1